MTSPTEPLALPPPRGLRMETCPFCAGGGFVHVSYYGPRECPTCRGARLLAVTWLTEVSGILRRAREMGLAA